MIRSSGKGSRVGKSSATEPDQDSFGIQEGDMAILMYTGGTTGFPKGVPGNHIGMTSYVNDVTEDVAGPYLKEGEDVYLAVVAQNHIGGAG